MAMVVGMDVTEDCAAGIATRRADRLAALGTMTAGIAHEINNPLGTILVASHVLEQLIAECEQTAASEEALENVGHIVEAANRCAAIVRRVLTFARGQADAREPRQLEELIQSAVRLTGSLLDERGISVHIESPPQPVHTRANATEVQQVLVNLLHNAAAAGAMNIRIAAAVEPGERAVATIGRPHESADESAGADPPQQVLVCIEDDGQGMSPEQISRATEPFYSSRHDCGGTGLGLSICRSILEDHGGRLELESTVVRGTIARFTLPLCEPPD